LARLTDAITFGSPAITPMQQLLVYIAKGDGSMHGDGWRPLGMPSTLKRIHSAAIYTWIVSKVSHLLHPAQALLNAFKEPQGNFMEMQNWLFKNARTGQAIGVLLSDMIKAFEIINPIFVMKVLACMQAPAWLIQYAQFILFGRKVRPKIKGVLLRSIAVHVASTWGPRSLASCSASASTP